MSLLMNATGSGHGFGPRTRTKTDAAPGVHVFEPSLLQQQVNLPPEFLWPEGDLEHDNLLSELSEPLIDLEGFLRGDEASTAEAVELIRAACSKHGFFQVRNHGVDADLIRAAHEEADSIFKLPLDKKLGVRRKPGGVVGYSGAHADRFSSKLPWKETFSFKYHENEDEGEEDVVVDYFKSALGDDFERTGDVYQRYCQAMKKVAMAVFELLGISLGVDGHYFRRFYEDGSSIMRCNYYPICNNSNFTLGTGPHCDPNALTILHQDQVGGLQVFADNKWRNVQPRPDSLVINIGDTFTASSNGMYKSCLHRAVVNKDKERRSLVFFVCPREDKVVRPPQDLLIQGPRKYPDFTWSHLLDFTQNHYRADVATLHSFIPWLLSSQTFGFPMDPCLGHLA